MTQIVFKEIQHIYHFYLAEQLWTYDNGSLKNKNGAWQFGNLTWNELPEYGNPGIVQESSGKVLTIKEGNGVDLEDLVNGSDSQLWTLDATFKDGYFTLKNPKSGGYLTATSSNSTSIEGNQYMGPKNRTHALQCIGVF